jgi:hypothetical protein
MEFTNLVQGLTQFIAAANTDGSSEPSMVQVPNSTAAPRQRPPETPTAGAGGNE